MDMMYMKRYPKHYKEVRNITKYKYYNKLYRYLNRIDSKEFSNVYKIGESFDMVKVMSSLEDMLRFYEGIEHYEKCAVIKRYQDLVSNKDVDIVA
jgi:hypothetical protein